jgi:primary-amine oxidase
MTVSLQSLALVTPGVLHPLDPLTIDEVRTAVSIVRSERQVYEHFRIPTVVLHEPPKADVQQFQMGDPIPRHAFLVLLDNQTGTVYEAVVDLKHYTVLKWEEVLGVQPNLMADEIAECEIAVKADPAFQAALQKRGITDLELVMVDPWAIGHFGLAGEDGIRLSRALVWLRSDPQGNGYAKPIDGLVPVVDLNTMNVLRIEEMEIAKVPPDDGNYTANSIPQVRSDLKPLEITQPDGPSFTVRGHEVYWQKWRFRVGFTPREGLVLHTISYEDEDQIRPVLYRASLSEMVVPYGDPRPQHFRKNAFDLGEHGVGMLANSLKVGCDCLGEIYYFDAVLTNSRGEPAVLDNAICLHEEDYGVLWKHSDWRLDQTEVRRSRRLAISFFATVDNYDYGFFWYFYQDGTIEFEVKLTGVLLCSTLADTPKYGTLVAPELNALNHQHFFCVRLDMEVDGTANSIYEVNTKAEPIGETNPYGNAFYAESTLLPTEQAAQRLVDPLRGRFWKVVNPSVVNRLGQPVGYKLIPGENTIPFAHPDSPILKRAGFMTQHFWATPYHPDERYPAGNYPNQHPGGEGLPKWTQANRSIENADVVVWYTFGHHHIPRPEDWPVMPVAYSGFMLKPVGFFVGNPALDVPPSGPKSAACEEGASHE